MESVPPVSVEFDASRTKPWAVPVRGTTPALARPGAPSHAEFLLDLVRAVAGCEDFDAAALTVCTRLASALNASRVILGWRGATLGPTRPLAMSGAGVPEWDAESVRSLAAVLDEAIDQSLLLCYPAPSGTRAILRAHQALCRRHGLNSVITAPLAVDTVSLGAFLFEFEHTPSVDVNDRIAQAVELVAPWLKRLHAHRASLISRWVRRRHGSSHFSGRRLSYGLWLTAGGLIVLGLTLPIQISVSAPARIEGEVQRSIAAPIRGYLKAIRARPGDEVGQGQLLAELGDRDLELERAKLSSELAQHAAAVSTAMARGDRSAMAIEQARQDEVMARLGLIEHQLEQIRVQAPMAGVVIKGDWTQRVGVPVDRGAELSVVAREQRFRVII